MQAPVSRDLPHRGELLAAAAVLIVLAHALFAQLTGLTALACPLTGRATRWRIVWLVAPAGAGLIWTLAVGTRPAVAGLIAGPAHVLSCLQGHPPRLAEAFAGAAAWLPRQLPLALITGPAEAALAWPLRGPAGHEPRPGLVAGARRRLNLRRLRDGELPARDGAVLGVDEETGAPVALSWSTLGGGVLVTGAPHHEVTETAWRLVRAALRRRKPVIVIDLDPAAGVAGWLGAECARYGCPIITELKTPLDVALLAAVRGRAAALVTARGDPALAVAACEAVVVLCGELLRIGADGDGLVWLRGCQGLSEESLASLAAAGAAAGLPLVLTASDPGQIPVGIVIRHTGPGELTLGSRRVVTP
jgi:hypothetical protein